MKNSVILSLVTLAGFVCSRTIDDYLFPRNRLMPRAGNPPGDGPTIQSETSRGSSPARTSREYTERGYGFTPASQSSYGRYPNTDSETEAPPELKGASKRPPTTKDEAAKAGIDSKKIASLLPAPGSIPKQALQSQPRSSEQPRNQDSGAQRSQIRPPSASLPRSPSEPLQKSPDELAHSLTRLPHEQHSSSDDETNAAGRFTSARDRLSRSALRQRLRNMNIVAPGPAASANPSGFMGLPGYHPLIAGSRDGSPDSSSSSGLRTSSTVSRASSPAVPGSLVPSRVNSPVPPSGQAQQVQKGPSSLGGAAPGTPINKVPITVPQGPPGQIRKGLERKKSPPPRR